MTHKARRPFRYGSTKYEVGDPVEVNKADLPLLMANGYIEAEAPKKKAKTKKAEG